MDLDSKLVFVMGTRPEIIKLGSTIRECAVQRIPYQIIHTGQHYDFEMSEVFFRELRLSEPDCFLGVGSGTHAEQTGAILQGMESAPVGTCPRCMLVGTAISSC